MNSQVAVKSTIHDKDQKKMPSGHGALEHGVHVRGKLLPRQKHTALSGVGIQPNGDPTEVMLWGDL